MSWGCVTERLPFPDPPHPAPRASLTYQGRGLFPGIDHGSPDEARGVAEAHADAAALGLVRRHSASAWRQVRTGIWRCLSGGSDPKFESSSSSPQRNPDMHSPEVDSFLPRIHALIVATVTLLSALIVAESHSASNGVLVDRIGRPLRGVTVELEHAGVNGTTDASGRWVLDASSRIGRLVPARDIRWEAGRLIIGATREQMAKLSVFDVRGMRLTHDMTVRLVVGKNGIVLPEIPSGLAWVRLEAGEEHGTFLLNSFRRGQVSASEGEANAARRTAAIEIDTFRFTLAGRVLARIPNGPDSLFDTLGLDTSSAYPWNPNIQYGQLVDERDHQVYRTVRIGRARWMAENLAFKSPGNAMSWCYDDKPLSCMVHGRLYTLNAAMNGYPSSTRNPSGFRGICPSGWHMPSDSEWLELQTHAGGDSAPLARIFAKGSWTNSIIQAKAGDSLGFRALASGESWNNQIGYNGTYAYEGEEASFWSITDTIGIPNSFVLRTTKPFASRYEGTRSHGHSVRCVEGDTTYPLKLKPPRFNGADGIWSSPGTLVITPPMPIAAIHCTTDGSAPDSLSPVCPTKLEVDRNMTIRAIATYPGMFTSDEASVKLIVMGRFTDARDSQEYATVVIGSQTWMAQNLNFDPGGDNTSCYENRDKNCASLGRLYNWSAAMSLPDSCNSSSCSSLVASKHRGACPGGWRIPSNEDWKALMVAAGNDSLVGQRLKSTYSWTNYVQEGTKPGKNTYGFAARPGGCQIWNVFSGGPDLATANISDGTTGIWTSSSEFGPSTSGCVSMYSTSDAATLSESCRKGAEKISVRCVRNP